MRHLQKNLSNSTKPNIWLLLDDRAGNREQCLGVGEALGFPFEIKEIRHNFLAKVPNRILGASFIGISSATENISKKPFPDLIISAGRRSAPVAQKIKLLSDTTTKLLHIMWPSITNTKYFDLIAVPNHDSIPNAPNILRIQGSPHRLFPSSEKELKIVWEPRLCSNPSPRIALIVGGSTKNRTFTLSMIHELAHLASEMANSLNGSLLISTSRRTGFLADDLINRVTAPETNFRWGDYGENPYKAFLAVADAIIVTGDSVSMCSEACFSEKPVYIFAPKELITDKHRRFHEELYSLGYAKPIINYMKNPENSPLNWRHPPLNSAVKIAEKLKNSVLKNNFYA